MIEPKNSVKLKQLMMPIISTTGTLSENEALYLLLDLIMPENPDAATVERSARVHPLTEHEQC